MFFVPKIDFDFNVPVYWWGLVEFRPILPSTWIGEMTLIANLFSTVCCKSCQICAKHQRRFDKTPKCEHCPVVRDGNGILTIHLIFIDMHNLVNQNHLNLLHCPAAVSMFMAGFLLWSAGVNHFHHTMVTWKVDLYLISYYLLTRYQAPLRHKIWSHCHLCLYSALFIPPFPTNNPSG